MLPGQKKYPHIFSPGKLGKLETKNRIKYASTETNFNYGNGYVADKEVAYMEAQARGGAGIVTTQGAYTDESGEGKGYVGMMAIWDDKFIPGLKRIADVIRKYDAVSVLQLMHCGRVGGIHLDYTVGPSVVDQRLPRFRPPREMSKEDIERCIEEHVQGARRCVEAGFDAIEISGIVGYLLSNFISSYTNKRTDEFGGGPKERAEFPRRIVAGIRKEVGPDYPIIIRLCGEELLLDRGGSTPEESLEINRIICNAGVDLLSVTVGWQESAESVISRDIPQGNWLYVASRMKENLGLPVSMAYRLFEPKYPEAALAEGVIDFWESCRAMIADPTLPNKILEGREEDIIPCMACNICLARLFRDAELTCGVRPTLGHESEADWGFYGFKPTREKKKVMIVGAGLAGLQAGVVISEKGHDVTIYEKKSSVGGQAATSAKGPWGDEEFMRLVDHLKIRCEKNGAKIVTGKSVTPDLIDKEAPDRVILATGALPDRNEYPGGDGKNVLSCLDVLDGVAKPGKRVVVVGSKGVAISTALFLVDKGGYEVSMVGPAKKFGLDVNPSYIWRYMKKLKEGGVKQYTKHKIKELKPDGVLAVDAEGNEVTIPCDTIVLANMAPNNELKYDKSEVYTVGDTIVTRRASTAIHDGYRLGMTF
ncbi:MAG: FAD-dependent oxidoreductase [Phycisphaerales bacterium]|nr:MAG: FAD-dependent oxidoreductase [Phycisphaerales bacterium]